MYRPSDSFRSWSNKKAQKKAGTYIDALTYYANKAKHTVAEETELVSSLVTNLKKGKI